MEYTVSMNYPIDSWEFGMQCDEILILLLSKLGMFSIHVVLMLDVLMS